MASARTATGASKPSAATIRTAERVGEGLRREVVLGDPVGRDEDEQRQPLQTCRHDEGLYREAHRQGEEEAEIDLCPGRIDDRAADTRDRVEPGGEREEPRPVLVDVEAVVDRAIKADVLDDAEVLVDPRVIRLREGQWRGAVQQQHEQHQVEREPGA